MQNPLSLTAVLAATVMLAACGGGEGLPATPMPLPPSEASAPPPTPVAASEKVTANFTCESGSKLNVVFDNAANTATVTTDTLNGVVLPGKPVASGFWYSNGRNGLRGKGKEAMWEVGRALPVKCTQD